MIRVFDFRMEGSEEIIKLASMSHKMAKLFVEQGQQMLQDQNLPLDKWTARQNETIALSMKRAGTETPDLDELDLPTLNAMFLFILEKSGLATKSEESKTGEAKAA